MSTAAAVFDRLGGQIYTVEQRPKNDPESASLAAPVFGVIEKTGGKRLTEFGEELVGRFYASTPLETGDDFLQLVTPAGVRYKMRLADDYSGLGVLQPLAHQAFDLMEVTS